jgi:hypothetical protein
MTQTPTATSTSTDFGTIGWARQRSGQMTRPEKLREFMTASRVLLPTLPAQIRMRMGAHNPKAVSADLADIPVPDSKIAREAEEQCREVSPQRLVNHCLRTYTWAMLLSHRGKLRPDPELLYVAAMLHDLALTDSYRDANPMVCFGARGGVAAAEWAQHRGWPDHRCATLADAISLHLNAYVHPKHGPEAQLLQAGAAVDVIGLGLWELSRKTVRQVVDRYPMLDMIDGLAEFTFEARHPHTRAQLLTRWLMFGTWMRHSPLLSM